MDTVDTEMGDFNLNCYYKLLQYFQTKNHAFTEILGEDISAQKIESSISSFDENPFLFIAYSHGEYDKLTINADSYISRENAYFFNRSVIYTVSCLAAKELGQYLMNSGAISFWGYEEPFYFTKINEEIFADCANYGILHYLETNDMTSSFSKSKEYYRNSIEKVNDFFLKSQLLANRNAMVLLS